MGRLWSLIRISLKMNLFAGMSYKTKKGRDLTAASVVGLFVVLAVAFIPIIVNSTTWLYDNLAVAGMQHLIVVYGSILAVLVVMVFSTLHMLEVFYYSNDIEYLIPMPFKPFELVLSKFMVALMGQYAGVAILYLPLMVTYGVLDGADAIYFVLMALMFFLIPIFPTVLLCSVLMIIMRFTNVGKNRDLIRAGFLLLFTLAGSSVGMAMNAKLAGVGADFDISVITEMPVVRLLTTIFQPVMMGIDIVLSPAGQLLQFLMFLVIIVGSLVTFLGLAQVIYIPAIIGFGDSNSKRESLSKQDIKGLDRGNTVFKSLMSREIKTITRTPIFFLSCFLMPLLVPVIMVFSVVATEGTDVFELIGDLRYFGVIITEEFMAMTLGIVFAILYFFVSTNNTAMSSFSREGKSFFVLKYLPINRGMLIFVKLVVAVMFQLLPQLIVGLGIVFGLNLSFGYAILLFSFIILAVIFSSLLYIIFDLMAPRLNWDSEQQAMKGGLIQAILMLLNMGIAVLIGYLSFEFATDVSTVLMLAICVPLAGSVLLGLVLSRVKDRLFDRIW